MQGQMSNRMEDTPIMISNLENIPMHFAAAQLDKIDMTLIQGHARFGSFRDHFFRVERTRKHTRASLLRPSTAT